MADVGIRITAKDDTSGAFANVNRGLETIRGNAAIVNNALAAMGIGLSAGAFVAWTKNIVNSIDALNDLKDATGASIENISALEDIAKRTGASFDTVSTSLIKLNQGLNAAKPGSDAALAIEAIGLSVKDLKAVDPAEAFQRIAIGLSNFADDGNKARITQELFGKSLKEVAPLLKDAAEAGKLVATITTEQAEAAEKLNKQLFNLQTNSNEAARSFVNELIPTVSRLVSEFTAGQKAAGGFARALLLIGTTNPFNSIQENLKVYREQLDGLSGDMDRYKRAGSDTRAIEDAIKTAKARLDYFKDLQRQEALTSDGMQSAAETRRLTGTGSARKLVDIEEEKARKKAIEDANKAAAKAAQEYARELDAQNKLLDTLSGYSASYAEDVNRIAKAHANGRISLEAMAEAQRNIFAQQPLAKQMAKEQEELAKAAAKAYLEEQKAYEERLKSLNSGADSVEKHLQRLEDEEQAVSLAAVKNISLAEALERVALARAKDTYAKAASEGADGQVLLALQREVKARESIVSATASKDLRDENTRAAKEAADEWKRAANQIESSITDALMRAFESGKDIFTALRDTITNIFKTMVLRPVVQSVVTGGLGALGGNAWAAGSAGAAGAAGVGAGSLLGGMANGLTSFGAEGSASAMFANSSLYSTAELAGAALPYVGMAVAALAVMKSLQGGGYAQNVGDAQRNFGSAGQLASETTQFGISAAADATINSMVSGYTKAAVALGVKDLRSQFGYGSTDTGKVVVTSKVGDKSYNSDLTESANLQMVASRAVLSALQGSDLPQYLVDVFNNIDVNTASQETINTAMAFAGSLKTVRESMVSVGEYTSILNSKVSDGFSRLGTSADSFKSDFVKAIEGGLTPEQLQNWQALAGDMNVLADLTGNYSMKLRSQSEILKERVSLQDQLDGLTMTTVQLLKKQRDAVDESNRGLFDQVQIQKDLKTAAEAASEVMKANAEWQDKLDVLTGAKTDRQIAKANDLAKYTDATTQSLIDQYYTQLNLKDAADAAAKAQEAYATQLTSLKDRVAAAATALTTAQSAVDAIRAEGTGAYLAALGEVNAAQDRVAQLQLSAQMDIAKAANDAAKQMGTLGEQLHDFIDGLTIKPTDSFAKTLTAALAGDKAAMAALPGSATGAIDAAKNQASSASEFALLQGKILAQVNAAALVADAAARNTMNLPAAEDPLVAANRDLTVAQGKLATTLEVANQINAPLTASINDLVSKYASAQVDVAKALADQWVAKFLLQTISGYAGNIATTTADMYVQADTNHDGVVTVLEAIQAATEATQKNTSNASLTTGTNMVVAFAQDDPIRSVFDNISKTNSLLIDGLQLQLTQLLGTAFDEQLKAVSAKDSMFIGTYQLQASATGHLETIAANSTAILSSMQSTQWESYLTNVNLLNGIQVKFDRAGYTSGVYATGGAFTNGIVTRPTMFNASLMGEAGPEAIMPLANINGSLGVRVQPGSGDAVAAEVRALREEQRSQAGAMVQIMQRLTKLNERWDATGIPETRVTA